MKTLLILLLLITPCYAGHMVVETGYGYIKDSKGNITDKAVLPKGEHPLKDGYTYVEVADEKALEAVKVYVEPPSAEELAKKNADKEKQDALEELIQERITAKKKK